MSGKPFGGPKCPQKEWARREIPDDDTQAIKINAPTSSSWSSSLTLTLALALGLVGAAVLCAFPSHLPALAWMGCTVTRSWARVQDHRTQQKQNVVFGTFFACLFALLHRYFFGVLFLFFVFYIAWMFNGVLQLTNKNSAHSPTDKHTKNTLKCLTHHDHRSKDRRARFKGSKALTSSIAPGTWPLNTVQRLGLEHHDRRRRWIARNWFLTGLTSGWKFRNMFQKTLHTTSNMFEGEPIPAEP